MQCFNHPSWLIWTNLIHFVNVEDSFWSVTDDKDEDNPREEGGHGAVPPVRAAGGPGHEGDVVTAGAGDRSEDQPVEDGQQQHGQQTHHCSRQAKVMSFIMRTATEGIRNDVSQILWVVS